MTKDEQPDAIEVKKLIKIFKLPHDNKKSIKQSILSFRRSSFENQIVLDGVSFSVKKGEFFGILGRNGSGKSTLLKLLAGIYEPTSGTVRVHGKLTPFIELGIGFNPELTGRDNVFLNAAILGLSRKEIEAKYDEIVRFAELERYMDQKLRNYSSGMLVRLAFSISIQAHNNVLLIDEVLAVGDVNFQQKCLNIFRDMKKTGKTVVLVTHDMSAVEEFCDRAILIDKGKVLSLGNSKAIANLYRRLNFEELGSNTQTKKDKRWGNKAVTIEAVELFEADGKKAKVYTGEQLLVHAKIVAQKAVENPILGIQIRNATGQILMGTNSKLDGQDITELSVGDTVTFDWRLPNIFKSGMYTLTIAAHDLAGEAYDWIDEAVTFTVQRGVDTSALVDPSRNLQAKISRKDVNES